MAVVITLAEAAQHFDALNKDMVKAAERGLHSAALRGVRVIKTEIIPARSPQPVDRGVFRAGWNARRVAGGSEIYNDEPHTLFVEGGVRPENVKASRAMLDALVQWIFRKGLVKQRKHGFQAHGEMMARQLAWAIISRMKKRGIHYRDGIPGQGILAELIEKRIGSIMDEEITRELGRIT